MREELVLQQPGSASAVFVAARTGRTTVSAVMDVPCVHESPACAPPSGDWSVTIDVVSTPTPAPVLRLDGDGRPVSGAETRVSVLGGSGTVEVVRLQADGSASVLRTGTLAQGQVTFALRPDRRTTLQARYRDDSTTDVSDALHLSVAAAVSITGAASRPTRLHLLGRHQGPESRSHRDPVPRRGLWKASAHGSHDHAERWQLCAQAALHRKWTVRLPHGHGRGHDQRGGHQPWALHPRLLTVIRSRQSRLCGPEVVPLRAALRTTQCTERACQTQSERADDLEVLGRSVRHLPSRLGRGS